jgi:hypothetical protein
LKFGGAVVVAGQFGGWTPIGAEATGSGYQVAWKVQGMDQYTVWNVDSSGNYVGQATGLVSGNSTDLESLETSFHQDLNGDGVMGIPSATTQPGATTQASAVSFNNVLAESSNIVTLKGVADASSQIKFYDGNLSLGTATAGADGTWSFKTSSALSDTVHTFKAQETDSTGHVIASSGSAILGSTGRDTLTSSSGNDFFVGNGSADTFVFAPNFGHDVIGDFVASGSRHDTIQFSKNVFDSFASVLSHASQVGQDVVISTTGDTLTLKNTKLDGLNSHDFHFA